MENYLKLNGKIITKADVALMSYNEIKDLIQECKTAIEAIDDKEFKFKSENFNNSKSARYQNQIKTYNFVRSRINESLIWIKRALTSKSGAEYSKKELYFCFYKTCEKHLWKPIFNMMLKRASGIAEANMKSKHRKFSV